MTAETLYLKEIADELAKYSTTFLLKVYFQVSKSKKIATKFSLIYLILLSPPGLIRQVLNDLNREDTKPKNNEKVSTLAKNTVYYLETPILKALVDIQAQDGDSDIFIVKILSVNRQNKDEFIVGEFVKIDKKYIFPLKNKFPIGSRVFYKKSIILSEYKSSSPIEYEYGEVVEILNKNKNYGYVMKIKKMVYTTILITEITTANISLD